MKIGFFSEVYKPVVNGVVFSMQGFKKSLESSGHDVYLFTSKYPDYLDDEKNVFRCPSLPLPANYRYGFASENSFGKKANSILKDLDIVHTHHPFVIGKFAAKFAKKHSIPLVFTNHTQYEQYSAYIPFSQGITKSIIRSMVKDFANKCDCVISPSETMKKILISHYEVCSRIVVVPNGVGTARFHKSEKLATERLREVYGIKKNDFVLMFVGRLAKEKNIPFLLDSLKLLVEKEKNLSIKLLLVGSGPYESEIHKMAVKLGIEKRVIFTGMVPNNNTHAYYHAADIFVTGSKTEVHPLSVIEAMASGLVPVALDAAGFKDMIHNKKDGFLAQESVDDFNDKIISLLNNNSMRKKMSGNAVKTAEQYSLNNSTRKLVKVYRSVLS